VLFCVVLFVVPSTMPAFDQSDDNWLIVVATALKMSRRMLFRRRNLPPPPITFDFATATRQRMWHAIGNVYDDPTKGRHFADLFSHIRPIMLAEYGTIDADQYDDDERQFFQHWLRCDQLKFGDCLELLSGIMSYTGYRDHTKAAIDTMNRVMRQDGIGYRVADPEYDGDGVVKTPVLVKSIDDAIFDGAVLPCLHAFANPIFKHADDELRRAFEAQKKGDFHNAIVAAGASLESTLKAIFDHKGWTYNVGKDALGKLVEVGRDNGLFPTFYMEAIAGTNRIRSNLGAHGTPALTPTEQHADHLIQLVCTHTVFLIRQAGLT
jgi:hypothetical protein